MNDRLLTDDEICGTCPANGMRCHESDLLRCHPNDCELHCDLRRAALAQDAETLAWVIRTIELNCGDGHDKTAIQIGVQEWQDFKLSLQLSRE